MAGYWQAIGSVRGACAHRHRDPTTAARCAKRDQAACASLGGGAYSDRIVVHVVNGREVEQSDDEMRWIDHILEG